MAGASSGNRARKESTMKKQSLLSRAASAVRNGAARVRRFFA